MNPSTNSIILRPKASSAIWLLFCCAAFVAGGIWIAQEKGWVGYLCAAFFALGIPVGIIKLLPGSTYLRIADDGLTFANMFKETTIPWNVIDQFFVVSLNQTGMTVHKMVGFNYVPSYVPARIGRRMSSVIAKCEGGLPDTYGKTAEELVTILNACLKELGDRHRKPLDEPKALFASNDSF